jgi:hypothetical protein
MQIFNTLVDVAQGVGVALGMAVFAFLAASIGFFRS